MSYWTHQELSKLYNIIGKPYHGTKRKSQTGGGSLREAIKTKDIQTVRSLIERTHADQDDINSALAMAIDYHRLDVVKMLIEEYKADQQALQDPALLYAYSNPVDLDLMKYLATHGALDYEKNFALNIAAEDGDLQFLKILIDSGAQIDNEALMLAVKKGHFEIVKYLIDLGVSVPSGDHGPILRTAIKGDNYEIVKYLHEHGIGNDFDTLTSSIRFAVDLEPTPSRIKVIQYLKQNSKKFYKDKFIKSVNNIRQLINSKDRNYYYKWQELCSTLNNKNLNELKILAELHGIPYINQTKRKLCQQLAILYNKKNVDVTTCINDTTLLGDSVTDIETPLLYTVKEEKGSFCFNIVELMQHITTTGSYNPYTKNKLPTQDILKTYKNLQTIVMKDKLLLTDVLDDIKYNKIYQPEDILKIHITNLVSSLNYPPSVERLMKMSNTQVNKMFDYLNENELMQIKGERTLNNLIMECTRLLSIDDTNKNTRKASLEVYLNSVFDEV